MSDRTHRMPARVSVASIGAAACLAFLGQPAVAQDPAFPSGTVAMFPPVAAQAADAEAGMVVHIDPQTGEILSEPAPGSVRLQLTPQERNAVSTSHLGLTQQPASVPGGGIKLDLQGRFQSPMVAIVDAEGDLKTMHIEPPADGKLN